jgi:hypothetical protein
VVQLADRRADPSGASLLDVWWHPSSSGVTRP